MASTTGKYSGRHPAITAFTATCSTVAVRYMGMNWTRSPFFLTDWPSTDANAPLERITVSRWTVISSSGLWLVPLSMAATRCSVGMTTGRPSVYLEKGAPSNLGYVYRLIVEYLGLLKGAFEQYPRLFGRPITACLFVLVQRPGQGVKHRLQKFVRFGNTAHGVARGYHKSELGDAEDDRIMLYFLRLFVENDEYGGNSGLLQVG